MEKDNRSIDPQVRRECKVGPGGWSAFKGTLADLKYLREKYGGKTPLAQAIAEEVRGGSGRPGLN